MEMEMKPMSFRLSGAIFILLGLVMGWAFTYALVGFPVLSWDSFPIIPIEYFTKISHFTLGTILISWLVSSLFVFDGAYVAFYLRQSAYARDVLRPSIVIIGGGILGWAIANDFNLGDSEGVTFLFIIVGVALGFKFATKLP